MSLRSSDQVEAEGAAHFYHHVLGRKENRWAADCDLVWSPPSALFAELSLLNYCPTWQERTQPVLVQVFMAGASNNSLFDSALQAKLPSSRPLPDSFVLWRLRFITLWLPPSVFIDPRKWGFVPAEKVAEIVVRWWRFHTLQREETQIFLSPEKNNRWFFFFFFWTGAKKVSVIEVSPSLPCRKREMIFFLCVFLCCLGLFKVSAV